MSIVTQEAPTKQPYGLPGLRVVRRQHSYHFTAQELQRCCAAHPDGCGFEEKCLQLYDRHCDKWKYNWRLPLPKSSYAHDPSWIPILSTRDTMYAIRHLVQEAQ